MNRQRYPNISALLFDQPWLITDRALQSMIARFEAATTPDLEAVASKLGRPLENTGNRVEQRGNVGILDINGPIFRYANLFSMISGATSVEILSQDFELAMNNPGIDHILLRVDSAGGEVNGIHDLAAMIRKGHKRKPVTAYVDGLGASAAYWLAAAAGKIYGSASSFTGSVGAVATLTDRRAAQERQGVKTYQIVSSQSPRKVVDPATDEGRAAVQEMVDAIGELFVNAVAEYRGISAANVISDFGKGFVLPARLALKVGMIDGISSEEDLIASLQQSKPIAAGIAAHQEVKTMSESTTTTGTTPTTAQPATIITGEEMSVRERQRIQEILALPEAQGRAQLAQVLAFEPGMTAETAQRILAAAAQAPPTTTGALDREMGKIKNPSVGIGAEDEDTVSAEAQRILAFVPKHQKLA